MSTLTHVNDDQGPVKWFRLWRRLMNWLSQWGRPAGPWSDHNRCRSVVKRTKHEGASIRIFTEDGYVLNVASAELAVGVGDVLTIWGSPPENIRGLAIGSTVLFWASAQDYAKMLEAKSSEYLDSLREQFASTESQAVIWDAISESVHPVLAKRLEKLAAAREDFAWRFLWREAFVSFDATQLSQVFKLRGDYYTLRSTPTWRDLKQTIEWKFMDANAAAESTGSAILVPSLTGPHSAASLDLTFDLAERLAKGELDGLEDVPALQDAEPPRLLDSHVELPPFPVYLTSAAPRMRLD